MEPETNSLKGALTLAFNRLETKRPVDFDYILDSIIFVAASSGRISIMSYDEIAVTYGWNERCFFRFDNSGALFRALLARLYHRCLESQPVGISGSVYGFEAYVDLAYAENKVVHLHVKTKNAQGFPEVLLENEVKPTGVE